MPSNSEFDPIFVWNEYKYLEDDFMKSLRYLPPITENNKVWSAHFADLLIRIGSVFDSFLKRALFSEFSDTIEGIKEYREKYEKNKIVISDYYSIFEHYYELSSKSIFNIITSEPLSPFLNWKYEKYKPLEWWKVYTDLKHDRFVNKEKANLESTLHALGGLFLLNILNADVSPLLVDYRIIVAPNLAKRPLKSVLLEKEPLNGYDAVFAKTNLFGYVFDIKNLTFDEKDKMRILSPSGALY